MHDTAKSSDPAAKPAAPVKPSLLDEAKRRYTANRPYWLRVARTIGVVIVALILAWILWWYYMRSPWTRDGRTRAEVVDVAAQISGQVVELPVVDNQVVHKGDVLFVIDRIDYTLALQQAAATLESRSLSKKIADEDSARRKTLGDRAVSTEEIQTAENTAAVADAGYQLALAARDTAKVNLDRTTVYSPVNGIVTNLHLRVGDYATPGATKLSIIDSDSFWIAGYFEETKLPNIHINDFARVKLMGVGPDVEGRVESLAYGIADANGGGAGTGLANVDPIFTWVRLAQRIPVRIHIDRVPKEVRLVAGQTCTIIVEKPRDRPPGPALSPQP
jgi:multidrug resistance efflux pump